MSVAIDQPEDDTNKDHSKQSDREIVSVIAGSLPERYREKSAPVVCPVRAGLCAAAWALILAYNATMISEVPPNIRSIPTSRPTAQAALPGKPTMMRAANARSINRRAGHVTMAQVVIAQHWVSRDPEIRSIIDGAAKNFAALGADVDIVDHVHDSPTEILYTLLGAGLANAFRQFGFTNEDRAKMERSVVEAADAGANIPLLDYLAASQVRHRAARVFWRTHAAFLSRLRSIVGPRRSHTPIRGGHTEGPTEERYTKLGDWGIALNAGANLGLQPAVSVPCGFTTDGLPVGLQVIGPMERSGDAKLLLQIFYEAHVYDGVIADGLLEDVGLTHHCLSSCPSLRRDEAISAEYLVLECAVECRFKVLL
jgi:hypothetical protein